MPEAFNRQDLILKLKTPQMRPVSVGSSVRHYLARHCATVEVLANVLSFRDWFVQMYVARGMMPNEGLFESGDERLTGLNYMLAVEDSSPYRHAQAYLVTNEAGQIVEFVKIEKDSSVTA